VFKRVLLLSVVWVLAASATSASWANDFKWHITKTSWSESDETKFGEFVTSIGESDCKTVTQCLAGSANPYRSSDPKGFYISADCADLPYVLRAYYAWKNGLPFTYSTGVRSIAGEADIRFSKSGNKVTGRRSIVAGEDGSAPSIKQLVLDIRNHVSSAHFRVNPEFNSSPISDFYSPKVSRDTIKPGVVLYDVNGHVAVIYKVSPDGRVHYIDAHPDNTLTRSVYGRAIPQEDPKYGSGFKKWRPATLVGATKMENGDLVGGRVVLARNEDIPDFSLVQYYGTEPNPDKDWKAGKFTHGGNEVRYFEYIRHALADGDLVFDPVLELRSSMQTLCEDLRNRELFVNMAIQANIHKKDQPDKLPHNIYGTHGEWEIYSTPSRDARIKTAFLELYDNMQAFIQGYYDWDDKVAYSGTNLKSDLAAVWKEENEKCDIEYTNTRGNKVTLNFEQVMGRLFHMSFDPYHCIERRWGATERDELRSCNDGRKKRNWYEAQVYLRNQINRTYEAFMGYGLDELDGPGPGKGVAEPPEINVKALIDNMTRRRAITMAPRGT